MFYHELDGIGQDINFSLIYHYIVLFVAISMHYICHLKQLFKSMKDSMTYLFNVSPLP